MKKRILSLMLAALLCIGSTAALAETGSVPVIKADDVTDPETEQKIWTLSLEELDRIEAERAPIPELGQTTPQLIAKAGLEERKATLETMLTTDAIAQYRFYVHFSEDVDKPRSEEILYPVIAEDLWDADEIVQAVSARDLDRCKAAIPDLVKVLVKNEKSVAATEKLIMTDAKFAERYAYHLAVTLVIVDAYGHGLELRGDRLPGCIEPGSTGEYYCPTCDKVIAEAEKIPALGHDFAEGVCTRCQAGQMPFSDVKYANYFYAPVLWAVSRDPQVTGGYDDGTFRPQNTCTRAQIVTFIWRAKGCPEPTSSSCTFTDVAPGAYYYKAVLWAVENGITGGYDAQTFGSNDTVTRAQAMTFIWRAAGKPAALEGTENGFADVSADKYYYNAVLWAVANGITGGYNANTFGSNDGCTRGQIVTFLYRSAVE